MPLKLKNQAMEIMPEAGQESPRDRITTGWHISCLYRIEKSCGKLAGKVQKKIEFIH